MAAISVVQATSFQDLNGVDQIVLVNTLITALAATTATSISSIQSTLTTLTNSIATTNGNVTSLSISVASLAASVVTLSGQLGAIQTSITTLTNNLNTLNTQAIKYDAFGNITLNVGSNLVVQQGGVVTWVSPDGTKSGNAGWSNANAFYTLAN